MDAQQRRGWIRRALDAIAGAVVWALFIRCHHHSRTSMHITHAHTHIHAHAPVTTTAWLTVHAPQVPPPTPGLPLPASAADEAALGGSWRGVAAPVMEMLPRSRRSLMQKLRGLDADDTRPTGAFADLTCRMIVHCACHNTQVGGCGVAWSPKTSTAVGGTVTWALPSMGPTCTRHWSSGFWRWVGAMAVMVNVC